MLSTPASLLDRLRKPDAVAAWDRFVELYSPLLFQWARRLGQQEADAADLVQDVFLILFRKLPEFQYDPSRSFHTWLKIVFLNQHRARQRVRLPALAGAGLPEVAQAPPASLEDSEYRRYLVQQSCQLVLREFNPIQGQAFRQYAISGRPVEEVARELGLRPGTIYGIKSKVLRSLGMKLVNPQPVAAKNFTNSLGMQF
jgi:RNA polymerase sigma-70 factor (ECF subfamily)